MSGLAPARRIVPDRCIWCNRSGGELVDIAGAEERMTGMRVLVHPEHRDEAERFIAFTQRSRNRFFMAFVGMFAVAIPAFVILSSYGERATLLAVAGLLGYMAVMILVYPCATPQTVENMGIKRSIVLVRGMGIFLLVFAAAMATIALM